MPTLNWIGKEAVVRHHKDVPFRLLEPLRERSSADTDSGNLLVQGDNLDALKALLPKYAGKVKCIYIDQPYNTGNEGWSYNDNVNSPEIRKWLGQVVGREGEILDRHDRWLCMMYPRLVLLRVPQTFWPYKDVGHTQEAKKELLELVDFEKSDDVFITPKPIRLVQRILQIATDKDSLILDSFAGSGITGHAVLKQNAEDGDQRKFILVEMDKGIAENVTAERLRRVCNGYENARGQKVEALGSGFQYCTLSQEPLFTPDGQIRNDVSFEQLAAFVWFLETRTGYANPAKSLLLGVHEGKAIYLLYNGILGDKSRAGGNTLTPEIYRSLPPHDGPKILYAAACWGNDWLREENITFRQTPYELEAP